MPRNSLEGKADDVLAGEESGLGRYVNMRLDLVRELVEVVDGKKVFSAGETLHTAGGLWDTYAKKFVRRGTLARQLRLHPGQMEAGAWGISWLKARERGELLYENGKPVFSGQFHGARRAGKSDLANDLQLAYLVGFPGARGAYVVESFAECDEIVQMIQRSLPLHWATRHGDVGDVDFCWRFVNGSTLRFISAYDVKDVKKGRCDFVIMHEAQKMPVRAYALTRPVMADVGGIVLLTTNPPDEEDGDQGDWVETYYEKARAGKLGGKAFYFDWRKNPHLVQEALEGMGDEVDEETVARERDGLFRPKRLAIIHGFSPDLNVKPTPPPEFNITRMFTERELGAPHDRVHGLDFQRDPMASATVEVFIDPDDPLGDPLVWFVGCLSVPNSVESELVDALESEGYTGADAIVPDASGEWQDALRNPGKHSVDVFRARGWRKVYLPWEGHTGNPPIGERFKVANWLFGGAGGKRRAFVAPQCLDLIQALRRYRRNKKTGAINRYDPNAHLVDAATYPLFRLFPRRAPKAPIEYLPVKQSRSARRDDLEVY